MSCPCTQISTPSSNCTICGNVCTNCTCEQPTTPPVFECPEPAKCDEVYSSDCIVYNGADIKCSSEADMLFPGVQHFLVLGNGTQAQRSLTYIYYNINAQLCYLYSKEYITQMLNIIAQDEELSLLFCSIANSCDCTCSLTCPTIYSTSYTVGTAPDNDKIIVTFNIPTGGAGANVYTVAVYNEIAGLYVLNANTSVVTVSGSTGSATVELSGSGLPSQNWMVTVQVVNEGCTVGSYFTEPAGVDYAVVANDCGVSMYVPAPAPATCCPMCQNAEIYKDNIDGLVYINFTPQSLANTCIQPINYLIHYYQEITTGNFEYVNSIFVNPPFSSSYLYQLAGTLSTSNVLVLFTTYTADPNCYAGLPPRTYPQGLTAYTSNDILTLSPSGCDYASLNPLV